MGIRQLHQWIQWTSKSHTVCWDSWKGQRVGVDALSLLYRMRDSKERIQYIYSLVNQLREVGVEPVFVFDGRVPTEKKRTQLARRAVRERTENPVYVTTEDRDGIKQLLYTLGVLSVNAEGEADTVLAFAARAGWIGAIISTDLDYLPRGVGTLLLPTGDRIMDWKEMKLSRILMDADLSYQSFVHLCVLLGSDYSPMIPTLSYQSIYWALKSGSTVEEILEHEGIRNPSLWHKAIQILMGEGDRWEDLLSEKQRTKWDQGPPPPEPLALQELLAV